MGRKDPAPGGFFVIRVPTTENHNAQRIQQGKAGVSMFPILRSFRVRSFEKGLLFRRGEFAGILHGARRHWFFDPFYRIRVDVVSARDPRLRHRDLDLIVKSRALEDHATVVDLKDHERGLVWVDGRFARLLEPGVHALWTGICDVRVQVLDTRQVRFEHPDLGVILRSDSAAAALTVHTVAEGHIGLVYVDGAFSETLAPGQHAFWNTGAVVRLYVIDLREAVLDVAGQEIMTGDKVTLRVNAVVTYRVRDPKLAVNEVGDFKQALYREAQLALRAVVGARELDGLLTDRDAVARELQTVLQSRASGFGVEVRSLGIRDVVLPGDMKALLNQVTEARKAAEVSVITRREETAAMRSQANTARLLDNNPTLMRLRELEAMERVARSAKLNVVLGEKGLAERLVNLV